LIIAAVLALWSAVTTLSGFAQSYLQLAIARAGVGIGEGGGNPAALSMLSDHFPPQRRARAIAAFQAAGMGGILLTFLLGGWVAERFGWRSVFWVAGVPGLVLAVVFLAVVSEPERLGGPAQSQLPVGESLRMLKSNPAYRWIVFATALSVMGNLGAMQWLPLFFIRSHGLSLNQIGLFFGPAVACGMAAGMLLGGRIGDQLGRQSPARQLLLCIWANLALTPLYWLVLWVPSVSVALGITFLATATSVVFSPSVTAVMLTVCDARMRGMGAAVFNFANGIVGQALFPVIVGLLSDAFAPSKGADSLRYALTIVITVCLVAAALFVHAMRVTARQFSAP
jgi:MFS family permease